MDVTTRPILISQIYKLRNLFKRALREDFAYFPGEYIEQVSNDNNYTNFLRARINRRRIMLGLFESGELIGYAIADVTIPTDSDIFWFYIIPERRGIGLGKQFFNDLLIELRNKGAVHVYLITHNQQNFYRFFDFNVLNTNKDIFEGITVYEMAKDLVDG